MNNLNMTINDFLPESGWEDKVWGKSAIRYGRDGASLTRFNAELKLENDTLSTANGRRSVYLDFGTPINKGVLQISFKALSPSRGIGFVLGCGADPRSQVEVACNQELSDDVILNIDVRNQEVRYCSAQPNKHDANVLYKLCDNLFEYNKWYDVCFKLDYDLFNSSLNKRDEKWISFSMTDEDGEVLVDTQISHLSQAITTTISQFRVIIKEGSLIKNFEVLSSLTLDELSELSSNAQVQSLALENSTDETIVEDIEILTEQTNVIKKLSSRVIVGNNDITIPKYVGFSDCFYTPIKDHEDLIKFKKQMYDKAKVRHRLDIRRKYIDVYSSSPYFDMGAHSYEAFSDIDILENMGFKCIYIGYDGAINTKPELYGTFEGRNTHVITERDKNRCDFICNDDNASEIINMALKMYEGKPLVITFLDGDYKLDVNDGACIKLNRDNVVFRTPDANTNFTFKYKSYADKDVKIIDQNGHSDIAVLGLNFLLEDMKCDYKCYFYPTLSDTTQSVIDYVNSLDEYPGINQVSKWLKSGLPKEILENIELKKDNEVLQNAILELAQMVSEVSMNG